MSPLEPTDEMQRVAQDAYESGESWRSVVIAVLALVERDYLVACGVDGPDGERCMRPPRHDDLHAFAGALGLVMW